MRISKKSDYALRALVALADLAQTGEGLVSIRHLAEANDIPKRFLEQIMLDLREQGWVRAVTGRDGGYALALPASKLTVGAVVRHFDGVLAPIGCVSVKHYEPCSQEHSCRFRRVFLEQRNHAARMLDNLSLAELLQCQPVLTCEMREPYLSDGAGI